MAHSRRAGAERLEQLDLRSRVGDVIFASDDVGDAVINVVDDRRHGVDDPSVLTHQNRVRQARHMVADIAAHHVGPTDLGIVQAETPVRATARRLEFALLFVGQFQRCAVIDRGAACRQLGLALERQLFGRLEAGIGAAGIGKLFQRRIIAVETRRLPVLAVPGHAHPLQVGPNRRLEFRG